MRHDVGGEMNDALEAKRSRAARSVTSRKSRSAQHSARVETSSRGEARLSRLADVRRRERRERDGWCVLRTAPGTTLGLARSLTAIGIPAWTPTRTFKRPKPGRCNLIDGQKPTVEIDAAILPTFVFAPGVHLDSLLDLAAQLDNEHPPFCVFRHGGRYPLVAESEVAGLQQAEADAAELLAQMREAEGRDERRRLRAAAAKNERERQKVLRAERRHFEIGSSVGVDDMPALSGMSGIVESGDGRTAIVLFGGLLRMQVETWRLSQHHVHAPHSMSEIAA